MNVETVEDLRFDNENKDDKYVERDGRGSEEIIIQVFVSDCDWHHVKGYL